MMALYTCCPPCPDCNGLPGNIKGLRTRGGFDIVEMSWQNGKLTRLVIKSRLGGNCRIRTAQPLKGVGITLQAGCTGENPNKLFAVPVIATPIVSPKASATDNPIPQTLLYDLSTVPGKTYVLTAKE